MRALLAVLFSLSCPSSTVIPLPLLTGPLGPSHVNWGNLSLAERHVRTTTAPAWPGPVLELVTFTSIINSVFTKSSIHI